MSARIEEIRAENHQGDVSYDDIEWLCDEVERLNKWADGFSDAQLKERAAAEEYQRELRDALDLILPMAKGYAAEHPVGRNAEMVAGVNSILSVERTSSLKPTPCVVGEGEARQSSKAAVGPTSVERDSDDA